MAPGSKAPARPEQPMLTSKSESSGFLPYQDDSGERLGLSLAALASCSEVAASHLASNASTSSETPRSKETESSKSIGDLSPGDLSTNARSASPAPFEGDGDDVLPASFSSTPEMPLRDLTSEISVEAASFFTAHIAAGMRNAAPAPAWARLDTRQQAQTPMCQDAGTTACWGGVDGQQQHQLVLPLCGDAGMPSWTVDCPPAAAPLQPGQSRLSADACGMHLAASPMGGAQGCAPLPSRYTYRVAFLGGISVRSAPDAQAPMTGLVIPCGEHFQVAEKVPKSDLRIYLRLASGDGWVFDDAGLYQDDPSVVEVPKSPTSGENDKLQMIFATSPSGPFGTLSTSVPHMGGASSSSPPSGTAPASSTMVAAPLAPSARAWYQVAFCGGISVRSAPDVEAARTGLMLPCGAVFAATESVPGNDGRVYLKLSDGRGWVFDDSMIMPDDRSVVMIPPPEASHPMQSAGGHLQMMLQGHEGGDRLGRAAYGGGCLEAYHEGYGMDAAYGGGTDAFGAPSSPAPRRQHYWARGSRGGVKRNKWKRALQAQQRAALEAQSQTASLGG
eukprot:TRINITY_DN9018_c0_g1_i1.p1 TRINITY_DN9018_c0_g1~~TRINITY_DN9018_c0_g1_i1.p1  ORF type:complete len:607 (+),score=106.09 TRINITY_DN9018_c0_g1_i1:144-1823(+)